jgi:hypothetical protein
MRRRSATIAALLLAAACRHSTPQMPATVPVEAPTPNPPPISLWPATLSDALRAFNAGRNEEADRILRDHSARMAGTAEGAESDFWRAMLRADPANTVGSPRESIALFDAYIAAGPSAPRYAEAQIFRRLVEALDSTRAGVTALRSLAETRDKARDDEVRRLSEDLDKTMAELERIRRRLMPKPPQ